MKPIRLARVVVGATPLTFLHTVSASPPKSRSTQTVQRDRRLYRSAIVIATRARVWTPGLLVAVALLACESAPHVRSDYDKAADFGAFHTYNFVSQPSTDKLGYSSLLTQQIESAVATEMEKRGYMRSEHPDLLVNFSGKLRRMQKVESSPSAFGPYYGYRVGLYGAWPGYGNDVYTVNYTEGTLNIDLVDAARKQMVWEGVGVGEVTEEKQQNRQATLNAAVAAIFAKFPFRAGQSQPVATTTGR